MKIKKLTIKNFRGYHGETSVEFEDLTAFVGKNDVGKSSIMEALDVFFNDGKGVVKLDQNDVNAAARKDGDQEISIAICFCDLPKQITIDATNKTTLEAEYLLNKDKQLEVIKKYQNGGKQKVFIRAFHPTNPSCSDLLQKKDSELRKIIDANGITCKDKKKNAVMRQSIWSHFKSEDKGGLQLGPVEIDVTTGDSKSIWDKLEKYLPLYSLFQADRKNSDGDSEVQDPLKEAVKEILHDKKLQETLNDVAKEVETKLKEVSDRTLEKLREMSPDVASALNPVIPSAESLKWVDVFKNVSIASDENIPINKRGSGTKRLILLNFFRAEVERRQSEADKPSVIYAIEEPETSQHSENQKKLISALVELAETPGTQVIITTHSATIVKKLGPSKFDSIRIVRTEEAQKVIKKPSSYSLPYLSLNEINYLAFSEISEEYHNELFGYIKEQDWMAEFEQGKSRIPYVKQLDSGETRDGGKSTLTRYIRDQIHHPENKHNKRFNDSELRESIEMMRQFIQQKSQKTQQDA